MSFYFRHKSPSHHSDGLNTICFINVVLGYAYPILRDYWCMTQIHQCKTCIIIENKSVTTNFSTNRPELSEKSGYYLQCPYYDKEYFSSSVCHYTDAFFLKGIFCFRKLWGCLSQQSCLPSKQVDLSVIFSTHIICQLLHTCKSQCW